MNPMNWIETFSLSTFVLLVYILFFYHMIFANMSKAPEAKNINALYTKVGHKWVFGMAFTSILVLVISEVLSTQNWDPLRLFCISMFSCSILSFMAHWHRNGGKDLNLVHLNITTIVTIVMIFTVNPLYAALSPFALLLLGAIADRSAKSK